MQLERKSNVMIRLTEDERARLEAAWQLAMVNVPRWDRLPFAAWVRRCLVQAFPAARVSIAERRKKSA